MKTSIGGDRLGSGSKQEVSMKNYARSTHDLSYIWRSSMSAGTLVPFMSELGLPGDSFDIDLNCNVLTLPTVGPLFGSYKVQLDVFSCPVRLYNGKLHMNKLGIGMEMSEIKLPQMELTAYQGSGERDDNEQVDASCILSYFNVRGLGKGSGISKRYFSALPLLSYWDIYKQYYANKQEEEGVMISRDPAAAEDYSIYDMVHIAGDGTRTQIVSVPMASVAMGSSGTKIEVTLYSGIGEPNWNEVKMKNVRSGANVSYSLDAMFNTFESDGLVGTWSQYIGSMPTPSDIQNDVGQLITANIEPNFESAPQLARFDLNNIDLMRENILKDVSSSTAFVLDKDTLAPYGNVLSANDALELASCTYNQEGLGIKTYQSDLFNNWISTEWIDGTNGINEVTAVDTSSNSFTIDALNLSQKVYEMLNRIAISGGSYDDWLDAVYTHERTRSSENPVYQGSLIKELSFEEVVSTAEAAITGTFRNNESAPLGTLAGRGSMTQKNKGGKIKVKIDEPSYVIGIVSLTPRVDYSQGNKWDMSLKTMDDFHKPALDEIGYQDLVTDQMAWFDTTVSGSPLTEPIYKSAGKQPAWINYMTNVNQVRGTFAEKNSTMFMVLNRRYENEGNGITDLTTYVDPSKFNHIFADTRIDAQNFWVQISNKITARRKMSAKVIPNL